MGLTLKNQQAEQLAAEVAALTGKSMTGAVIVALEAYKHALLRQKNAKFRYKQAHEFVAQHIWSKPTVDSTTSEEEIFGYGEAGV